MTSNASHGTRRWSVAADDESDLEPDFDPIGYAEGPKVLGGCSMCDSCDALDYVLSPPAGEGHEGNHYDDKLGRGPKALELRVLRTRSESTHETGTEVEHEVATVPTTPDMTVGGSTVRSTSSIHPLPSNDDHPNSEEASGSGKSIRSAKSIKSGRSGGPRPGASGASGSARSVSARTASSASDTPGTPADTAKIDFSVTRRPTRRQLWEFSKHELFDEDGNAFPFGKLYPDWPKIGPEPPEDDEEEEEQGQHGREREVLDDKPDHELSEEWETLPNPILQLLNAANSATKVSNPSHPSDPSHHLQPSTFGSVPLAPPVPEVKERKTAVFFIRALACGQCQDFVRNSISRINPETVAAAGVSVYVITNGGWKGLKKYRELMKCPFPIFVDPKRDLYTKLGMTPKITTRAHLKGIFKGPNPRPSYHANVPIMQTLHGLANMARLGTLDGGNVKQVGGEFILRPGYACEYTHRMSNKYDHDLAAEVLRAAGVRFPEYRSLYGPLSSNDHLTAEQLIELSQQEKQVSEWRRRIRERLPIGMSRTTSRTTSFPSSTPLFF